MEVIKGISIVFILVASLFHKDVCAQSNDTDYARLLQIPKYYTIPKTSEKITIDGKDDESDWKKAPWTQLFVDIQTAAPSNPAKQARSKMLWDNENLYVFVKMDESDLWATLRHHDDIVYQDNALEMFIDPGGDTYNYIEFQINALGTVWDLFMPRPYRNGGNSLSSWDIKDLRKAVYLNGTLNNPKDTDRSWSVELAIPFKSVILGGMQNPKAGTIWRMNFSRVEWKLDTLHDAYSRRRNTVTGRLLPENYFVWSPQGIINLHFPERWGYVLFSDTLSNQNFLSTEDEKLKLLLWKYYYLQQEFIKRYNSYAKDLDQLDKLFYVDPGLTASKSHIKLISDDQQFLLQVFIPALNKSMSVNEEGLVRFENVSK